MDTKTIAANGLKSACKRFKQDLEALPEEAFTKTFGPATRTVADIVYETNLVNDHIGMVMRGEEPFKWPEELWIKAPEGFCTKAAVIEAFTRSTEKIFATIDSFSSEELESPLETEDGESTRFAQCAHMTLHVWYHSGQLNFIQTLLGDAAWHWN